MTQELARHALKKSNWSKLLSPMKSWAKGHGLLDPSDELAGDDDEAYTTHPLWEIVARALPYREMWRRVVGRKFHINVLELRAHLAEERRIATSHRSLRAPFALDSQVCLGCLIKGRSSPRQLCMEMKRGLCYALGGDIYGSYMFFPSSFNRADGPTRGRRPDLPDLELPCWRDAACLGDFAQMDRWLDKMDAGGSMLPFHLLCGFDRGELRPNRVVRHLDRVSKPKPVPPLPEQEEDGEQPGLLSDEAVKLLKMIPKEQFFFGPIVQRLSRTWWDRSLQWQLRCGAPNVPAWMPMGADL